MYLKYVALVKYNSFKNIVFLQKNVFFFFKIQKLREKKVVCLKLLCNANI